MDPIRVNLTLTFEEAWQLINQFRRSRGDSDLTYGGMIDLVNDLAERGRIPGGRKGRAKAEDPPPLSAGDGVSAAATQAPSQALPRRRPGRPRKVPVDSVAGPAAGGQTSIWEAPIKKGTHVEVTTLSRYSNGAASPDAVEPPGAEAVGASATADETQG
jgi:hypothetical protein